MDWTLDSFAGLVRSMRKAQRDFYRRRRKASPAEHDRLLREALELETSVDAALAAIATRTPLFDREETAP